MGFCNTTYDPILGTKRVEDHDRWVSEFTPSESGEYEWYIFSSNGNYEEDFLFMAINLFRYWILLPINLY